MVIYPGKIFHYCIVVELFFLAAWGYGLFFEPEQSLIMLVLAIVFSPVMVFYGRSISMNAEGYTVRFLCFHKNYKWGDLRTKRYFGDLKDRWESRFPKVSYEEMVIFSPKQIKFPAPPSGLADYLMMCLVFRWSFAWKTVYLYFIPKTSPSDRHDYAVDRQMFWEKMREWDVVIQGEPK